MSTEANQFKVNHFNTYKIQSTANNRDTLLGSILIDVKITTKITSEPLGMDGIVIELTAITSTSVIIESS